MRQEDGTNTSSCNRLIGPLWATSRYKIKTNRASHCALSGLNLPWVYQLVPCLLPSSPFLKDLIMDLSEGSQASFYHLDSFLIVDFLYYLFNVAYIDILDLIIPNLKTLGISTCCLFSSGSRVFQDNEINSESSKEFWERSFASLPTCSSVPALHRMLQPFTPQRGFLLELTAFSNFLVYRFPLPSLSHNHY